MKMHFCEPEELRRGITRLLHQYDLTIKNTPYAVDGWIFFEVEGDTESINACNRVIEELKERRTMRRQQFAAVFGRTLPVSDTIRTVLHYIAFLLLIAIAVMILGQLAYAQEGTYNLTVEGKVKNKDGKPSAFTMVVLRTATGETFETQTGIDGGFTLQANTSADSGLLAVKSAFAEDMTFGQMALSWSAGGFGDKTLAADLMMDEDGELEVQGGGSEFPLPDTPGDDPMPGEALPSLPTVTPTVVTPDATPTVAPVMTPPALEETGSNTGLIIGLIVLGLVGLGLVGGGIVVLLKMSRGESNGD